MFNNSRQQKIDNYVNFAVNVANDDAHGYSQINRWRGEDYDCSSLVITAVKQSGIPVKATYTGNMLADFKKHGFEDVTLTVDLRNGAGLQRGDILLTPNKHTEIYIGDGLRVGAHASETGTKHGKVGDQTGNEISVKRYVNLPWLYVLRYTGN